MLDDEADAAAAADVAVPLGEVDDLTAELAAFIEADDQEGRNTLRIFVLNEANATMEGMPKEIDFRTPAEVSELGSADRPGIPPDVYVEDMPFLPVEFEEGGKGEPATVPLSAIVEYDEPEPRPAVGMSPVKEEMVDVSEPVKAEDTGRRVTDTGKEASESSMVPGLPAAATEEPSPEPLADEGGEGVPPEEPPVPGDAYDEGGEESSAERRARLEGELEMAVAAAAAFAYDNAGEKPQASHESPTLETLAAFREMTEDWGPGTDWAFESVSLRTWHSELATPEGEGPRVGIELQIFDTAEHPYSDPKASFQIFAGDEGATKVTEIPDEDLEVRSEPTDDELRALMRVAQELGVASWRLQEENDRAEASITTVAENTDYTAEDLTRLLDSYPDGVRQARDGEFCEPAIDPQRPDHWVRMGRAMDHFCIERPPTVAEAEELLAQTRKEHEVLAALGATLPDATQFIVTQGRAEPLVCIASKTVGSGETLHIDFDDAEAEVEHAPQHLRTAGIVFEYLQSAEERGYVLTEVTLPKQWGLEGQFYDIEPEVIEAYPGALQARYDDLRMWVEKLPAQPERDNLLERINVALESQSGSAADTGDRADTPSEVPPPGDAYDEGNDDEALAEVSSTDLQTRQEMVAQKAVAFIAEQREAAEPSPAADTLPKEETTDKFFSAVYELAQIEGYGGSHEYWPTKNVCLEATVVNRGRGYTAEEGREHHVDVTLSIFDPEKPPTADADEQYTLTLDAEQGFKKMVVVGDGTVSGQPTDGEVRRILEISQDIVDADEQIIREARQAAMEISVAVERTDYGVDDLQVFLEGHSEVTDGFYDEEEQFHPVVDPHRPDHWVRAWSARGLPGLQRPPTAEEVAEQLAFVQEEHDKLAALGAVIPDCTHFVIEQGELAPLVCTVSKTIGDGQELGSDYHKDLARTEPALVPQHLHVAGVLFDYLEASEANNDRHLIDIYVPRQWGNEGQLYDVDACCVDNDGAGSTMTPLKQLEAWVSALPSSPDQEALLRRITAQLQRLQGE